MRQLTFRCLWIYCVSSLWKYNTCRLFVKENSWFRAKCFVCFDNAFTLCFLLNIWYSSILSWLLGISQSQITMKRRGLPLVLDAGSLASLKYWVSPLRLCQWQLDSSPTCPHAPLAQSSHQVRELFFSCLFPYEDKLLAIFLKECFYNLILFLQSWT